MSAVMLLARAASLSPDSPCCPARRPRIGYSYRERRGDPAVPAATPWTSRHRDAAIHAERLGPHPQSPWRPAEADLWPAGTDGRPDSHHRFAPDALDHPHRRVPWTRLARCPGPVDPPAALHRRHGLADPVVPRWIHAAVHAARAGRHDRDRLAAGLRAGAPGAADPVPHQRDHPIRRVAAVYGRFPP